MTPSMNIAPDGPDIETGAFSDDVGGPGARAARAGVSSPAGVGDAEGLKPSIMARYGVALREGWPAASRTARSPFSRSTCPTS